MGSLYKREKSKFWWMKYRQGGRTVQESSGTENKNTARETLRDREGDVTKGVPINLKAKRVTFDDAAKDIENDYENNGRKSAGHLKRRLKKHLTPFFGGRRMLDITTSTGREYVAKRRAAGASAAEINRELAILKRMFTLCRRAGTLAVTPMIEMLKENNARRGFFEREPFDSVRSHLPAALQPVAMFAFLTGWRMFSEILPLEWRQVDWDKQVVRLDPGTTKNNEGRSFPFTNELRTLLEDQLAEHERLKKTNRIIARVFHRDGEPIKDFRGAWKAACTAAGVPGRLLHDFRRTAVRNLEAAGVSRSAAMAMVGHKTESIYRRYAIVDAVSLQDAAAKLDQATAAESARRRARQTAR
jgi:integrase